MIMHWRYLLAVLRHKWFVYREGRKLGLGRWQLLVHDWDKFLPSMWFPYAEQFYGNPGHKPEESPAFRRAWLGHIHRNKHHWQYWVLHEDSGKERVLAMPERDMLEMCADWRGANKAYGDMTLIAWYHNTAPGRKLHPQTRREVEVTLFGNELFHRSELLDDTRVKVVKDLVRAFATPPPSVDTVDPLTMRPYTNEEIARVRREKDVNREINHGDGERPPSQPSHMTPEELAGIKQYWDKVRKA